MVAEFFLAIEHTEQK